MFTLGRAPISLAFARTPVKTFAVQLRTTDRLLNSGKRQRDKNRARNFNEESNAHSTRTVTRKCMSGAGIRGLGTVWAAKNMLFRAEKV